MSAGAHRKALVKLLQSCSYRHQVHQVFSDFVELAALATANAVDWRQREPREARYLRILERYSADEIQMFPRMLAELVEALECEPHDALGMVFGELELGNAARGQFFTPYEICRLMADMTLAGEDLAERIREQGYITLMEPAAGAGAMIIALAAAMRARGFDYQRQLHVTAIDVDARAAHMAYLQLSLLYIPAEVVVGNTLTLEQREVFCTPAHILGGWSMRLRARAEAPPREPIPVPRLPDNAEQLTLFRLPEVA